MSTKKHKVLVANRGEIAIRIIQACVSLGLDFVCVYTRADEGSGHLALARQLGGPEAAYRVSSYHDANELLAVADHAGATAIHPGYGFFAEDFRFARRVAERKRGLIFIGPSWRIIRTLGDKINTKRLARSLSIPTVPGSDRPVYDELEAEEIAETLFAFQAEQGIANSVVLVKASAGGGGMGIEEIYDIEQFKTVYRRIRNYAKRQFHDEGVLIEQRIFDFNHLEVQIVADRTGTGIVHFGTRNCTIQSTGRQKRVEIAPGFRPEEITYAFDAAKLLDDITGYSLAMAREVGYDNVGTWEWIVSPTGQPFLMEVNTRIQVENGVSAAISRIKGQGDVNIIAEQIRLGLGEPMGYDQSDITFEGVGIEYRVIAEDPANRFTPWVGRIDQFLAPNLPYARLHTHIPMDAPYEIPTEYDPNLALAIIWGKDLAEAKKRGTDYLDELTLSGADGTGAEMKTNIRYLREKTSTILQF
ncbi:biotin carboxylase N-terminal domain-containing protein [Solidesulfovibrio magneticus]|uniref:biotin carboxylase n=1 Tax=Solidesulfovibrio magneticus (strain ATCC 700980 / DSM 13731 / RS-1) TaxID=573370 RepID=C4XMH0_SOLM1|nr:biotin carboxylase N-terminal domain-containing protein [Solidesulfovibrio magneticus]BAH74761.1 acetyl-CoA carboxylase biotin carboxylase subunit [Solidesulfovibrio magneticus RS-1]